MTLRVNSYVKCLMRDAAHNAMQRKIQVGIEKIVNKGLAFFLSKNHGSTQLVFLDIQSIHLL